MKRTHLTAALLACTLLAAPAALADTMTYDGSDLTSSVTFHGAGLITDGATMDVGRYQITYQQTAYEAYCVDADHWLSTTEVTEQSVDSLTNGGLVAYLYETYAPAVTDGTAAAALGVAIWEVIHENVDPAFDITSGRVYITGNDPVVQAANAMLATLPGSYESTTDLIVLHSDEHQDLLISASSVPEPFSLALLVVGAPLAVLRGRRRR